MASFRVLRREHQVNSGPKPRLLRKVRWIREKNRLQRSLLRPHFAAANRAFGTVAIAKSASYGKLIE
jgi:hypothetical protein